LNKSHSPFGNYCQSAEESEFPETPEQFPEPDCCIEQLNVLILQAVKTQQDTKRIVYTQQQKFKIELELSAF